MYIGLPVIRTFARRDELDKPSTPHQLVSLRRVCLQREATQGLKPRVGARHHGGRKHSRARFDGVKTPPVTSNRPLRAAAPQDGTEFDTGKSQE